MVLALSLEDVYEEIREDQRWNHLRQKGIVLVPGRGHIKSPLAMIVGEAPGATENTKRLPFCGISGRVLEQLMVLAGLYASPIWSDGNEKYPETIGELTPNAFITNVVKYRPPGNRTPTKQEVIWGTEALRKEWIALSRPSILVAVGSTARSALIPKTFQTVTPGKMVDLGSQVGQGPFVWVQYHPAWGLRQGKSGRRTMERHWEEMGRWIWNDKISKIPE